MTSTTKKQDWTVYGFWSVWISIAFFSIYPTCNWLSSQRTTTYSLYLDAELDIPFVPQFYWCYISIYILFLFPPFILNSVQLKRLGKQLIAATIIAGIIFLLIPTNLGFERIKPNDQFYNNLFSKLFIIDLPHNLVPSLHVVFSTIVVFAMLDTIRKTAVKIMLWLWLILICLSTLLVHQHHLLDVITGFLIAILVQQYMFNTQER